MLAAGYADLSDYDDNVYVQWLKQDYKVDQQP